MAILEIEFNDKDVEALNLLLPSMLGELEDGEWDFDVGEEGYDHLLKFVREFDGAIRTYRGGNLEF